MTCNQMPSLRLVGVDPSSGASASLLLQPDWGSLLGD